MASGTIKARERALYITPKFTYALPDGLGLITAIYNPMEDTVIGNFYVRGATAFDQNTNMFTIPEDYRPWTNYGMSLMIKSGGNWYTYQGSCRSDGGIRQALSSQATDVYGSFFYQLHKNQ